jgi:hypothetical protein
MLRAVGPGNVVGGREDEQLLHLADHLAGQRVQVVQPLHLVAEHLDPDGELLVDREDLDGVAPHAERAAREGQVVAGVLLGDQGPQQVVAVTLLPHLDLQRPVDVLLRRPEAVDAGHGRDDHDVAPGQQALGGGVAQPLHLLVDRGVLLDVGVGLRDVRLGLVVVVVRDEVLDGVVRQQLAELVGQLRGEGLVRRHHQRRALHLLDQPRRGRRLAGAGSAEEHDVLLAGVDPLGELLDRGRLVAGRLELADDAETPLGGSDVGLCAHVDDGTTRVRQNVRPARVPGSAAAMEATLPRSLGWVGRACGGRGGRGTGVLVRTPAPP